MQLQLVFVCLFVLSAYTAFSSCFIIAFLIIFFNYVYMFGSIFQACPNFVTDLVLPLTRTTHFCFPALITVHKMLCILCFLMFICSEDNYYRHYWDGWGMSKIKSPNVVTSVLISRRGVI